MQIKDLIHERDEMERNFAKTDRLISVLQKFNLKAFKSLEMFCYSSWAFLSAIKFEVNRNLQMKLVLEVSVNLKLFGQ